MNRTRKLLIATSFGVSAAVTAFLITRAPAAAEVQRAPAVLDLLTFALAPGQLVEHRVVLSQDVSVQAFGARGGAMLGQTSLDVVTRLVGIAHTPEGIHAALSFSRIHSADVTIQEQELLDDAAKAALLSPVASIVFGEDGRVRALTVPPGAHPMFARLIQLTLAETQLTLGAGAAWDASERTGLGTLRAHYVRTDKHDKDDTATLVRTATVATLALPGVDAATGVSLTGQRAVRMARGTVLSQKGEDHLLAKDASGNERFAQHTQVDVELVLEGTAAAPVFAALVPVDPYVVMRDDAAAAANALRQRVEGLTLEAMLSVVQGALTEGAIPDHDRFLWRATGLLQQQPILVASLKPLFFDTRASHAGRGVVLDLLVGARHGLAQELLVELLQSEVVEHDPQSGLLRQRLTFINHPTAETLAFVQKKAAATGSWRDPARMSLGSMAGSLARSERGQEAMESADLLVALHAGAADASERDIVVRALGNAGLDGFDGIILDAARAQDRNARSSAASALRKMRSDRSREALLALSRDTDAAVSRRAIDSLGERPYTAEIGAGVKSGLAARAIPDAAYQAVVSLLAEHARTDIDARAALELILLQDVNDKEVKGRIRQVLASLPS